MKSPLMACALMLGALCTAPTALGQLLETED